MSAAARPRAGLVPAALVMALVVAGCGGGEDAPLAAAPSPPASDGGRLPGAAPSPASPPPSPAPGPRPAPPVDEGPIASAACLAFPQASGATVGGSLASRIDARGGEVTFSIASQAAGGTVSLDAASGDFTYARSSAGRGDLDRFAYRVTDAAGRWSEAEVHVLYGARRIMPLGDSITDGVERYHPSTGGLPVVASRTGYRQALRERLVAAGYAVDLVGGERSGTAAGLADADHEGHPGYRQANIRDEIRGWLDRSPADVVLLHIGTNDINAASITDATATGEALSRMQAWSADLQKPPLTVMLATLIGQRMGGAGLVPVFNQNLVALHAGQWATPADRFAVSLVDMNAEVDVARHLTEPADDVTGLHPNREGYDRIAAAWFDALVRSQAVQRCP